MWMEIIKDYDFSLEYHLGKANVVANALSRRPRGIAASTMVQEWLMLETTSEFDLEPSGREQGIFLELAAKVSDGPSEWEVGSDGRLRLRSRLYVPDGDDLKGEIIREAHRSWYTVHSGNTKMYRDLRRQFWWNRMKRDVAEYVLQCLTCQQKAMGTTLDMSTPFHPQTDGQTDIVNQVMEDMLRACVLDFKGSWEDHLPLIEFAYNNSYHSMPAEVRDGEFLGPEIVQETIEKISIIRDRIRTAQSRQKSYVDLKKRQVVFEVGDHVFLKVSPMKGVVRFGKKGKLAPRLQYNQGEPVCILDGSIKRLRMKEVDLVKVLWSHHDESDASWELESDMRIRYPQLFVD
ncbi:uncharacterized protein LOC133711444 [Rosa rugosa]|uniref:uncharacterized protein LOC133711444 n=1 Tax=Rosa rugosa TaxID=74645 RepID=UPI002B403D6D|nr:uncharacterized protein LOC133711444 [Rosa rugosa]